jgi:acylphosphatase
MRGDTRADAVIARRLVVSGQVQGVGYRYAMTVAAQAMGVVGWVRNRRDGTVEALVQGEDEQVEGIVAWCRRGPPGSRVTGLATRELDADPALLTFVLRPTE